MQSILWIITSYLLGSIPFGYLVGRACGKNVLQVGWRKTSGSNVFKNVGKWQGVLTGLLDVLKGALAVFGAQQLGLTTELQVFSGVAAVAGHNWSLFLEFAGGRGIGTFIGAFLVLAPKILGISIIPLALLAIIWNAAIGTILFLAGAIIFDFYLNQFATAGLFTTLSLAPIFVKRLSPIKEIFSAKKKQTLFLNRLIFDNDKALWDLRIKRILGSKNGNPRRILKTMKPLAYPVILPSKLGFKAAKFGVGLAKKPIEKIVSKEPETIVTEITVKDFKKMLISSAKKIVLHQEEINRINVFPVADKDTGYNLAATLLGIEGVIGQKEYESLRELTKDMKEGAITNARGNAGMIFAGYFIQVLDKVKHLESINSQHFSLALRKGTGAAYSSIAEPTEGTILDAMKSAGEKSWEVAKVQKEENIIKVLQEAHKSSEIALKETKEKLEVLKKNNVVDAGALGFVKILESWIESLKGMTPAIEVEAPRIGVVKPVLKTEENPEYRYCFQFSFTKDIGDLTSFREKLSVYGDNVELLELEDKVRIHIHTNEPEVLKEKFADMPGIEWQVDDMQEQMKETKRKPIGIVAGQSAGLPQEFLKNFNMEEVPFRVKFHDAKDHKIEDLYQIMRGCLKNKKPLPTTSQPAFADFLICYKNALKKFDQVLVITPAAKLSGTYSAARIARQLLEKKDQSRIFVFDSISVTIGEGLVVTKAQELIEEGQKMEDIIRKLEELRQRIKLFVIFNKFDYIAAGGRLHIPAFLIPILNSLPKIRLRPLIELKNGKLKFSGIKAGDKNMVETFIKEIEARRQGEEIRIAITHADNPETVKTLKKELEAKSKVKILYIDPACTAIGVHVGPGSVAVAFYIVNEQKIDKGGKTF
ncbi:glycerol-3-phosphate acyltransferase [Patescibacteria group bacterium]